MHKQTLVPVLTLLHAFAKRLRFAWPATAILVAVLLGPLDAPAQKPPKWAEVGGWEIRVDPSVGNGCFAMQQYDDGTVVRIGVNVGQRSIYLIFLNDNWKSLEIGKVYPVRIVFDGGSTYNGEMKGHRLAGGAMVLSHNNLSSDFVSDFMQRNSMHLQYQGSRIAALSLRNTYAAVGELINCQKEFGVGTRDSDPFSSSGEGRPSRDPFR